jgi:hypothetical protein
MSDLSTEEKPTDVLPPARADDHDVYWLAASHRPAPVDALRRIRHICGNCPDLFSALMTVVATHQGLRHEMLATAVKQFRADLEPYSVEDVTGMLRACWNGGWQGFDAVLRSRRTKDRQGGGGQALGWMKKDD